MMDVPAFQRYQLAFTAHLRDPARNRKPDRVNAKRMRVYTEIVFNNLESTVAACFPVTKNVLGKRAWNRLVRGFVAGHKSKTPIFREIPQEFLKYIETLQECPPYLKSLVHYEWVELAVAVQDSVVDTSKVNPHGNLLDEPLIMTPAMMLLEYHYPVQLISPKYKPMDMLAEPVHLLVYRNLDDDVKFIALNAQTAKLLQALKDTGQTARQWLEDFSANYPGIDTDAVLKYGLDVLQDLLAQQVILGTQKLP